MTNEIAQTKEEAYNDGIDDAYVYGMTMEAYLTEEYVYGDYYKDGFDYGMSMKKNKGDKTNDE